MTKGHFVDHARGAVAGLLLAAWVIAAAHTCAGCAPATARRALVTSTDLVATVAGKHTTEVCDAVERRCKAIPCDALNECHTAQRQLRAAAKLWARGALNLNKLIPEEP